MNFNAKFKLDDFKKIVKGFADINSTNNLCLEVKESGINIVDDYLGVFYTVIRMGRLHFTEYNYEGNLSLVLSQVQLHKILKEMAGEVQLASDGNRLKITELSSGRTFDLRLMEESKKNISTIDESSVDQQEGNLAHLLTTTVSVPKEKFMQVVKDMKIVESDDITLIADQSGLKVLATDTSQTKNYNTVLGLEVLQPAKSMYLADHLTSVLGLVVGDTIKLRFGTDMPIVLSSEKNNIKVKTVLAPKVVEE